LVGWFVVVVVVFESVEIDIEKEEAWKTILKL